MGAEGAWKKREIHRDSLGACSTRNDGEEYPLAGRTPWGVLCRTSAARQSGKVKSVATSASISPDRILRECVYMTRIEVPGLLIEVARLHRIYLKAHRTTTVH